MNNTAEVPVGEPINTEPSIVQNSPKSRSVYFGNTGLFIDQYSAGELYPFWRFHYVYGGEAEPNGVDEIKKTEVFCVAFEKFIQWYQNDQNFSNEYPRVNEITGVTNGTFHGFFKNAIRNNEAYESIPEPSGRSVKDQEFRATVHMDKLLEDKNFLERIKKISQRAQKRQIFVKPLP